MNLLVWLHSIIHDTVVLRCHGMPVPSIRWCARCGYGLDQRKRFWRCGPL